MYIIIIVIYIYVMLYSKILYLYVYNNIAITYIKIYTLYVAKINNKLYFNNTYNIIHILNSNILIITPSYHS